MIEELYINEKYIELSESSKVGMSFQSNNLNSLSSRNGNFSNEFKVPKTKNNQIALEYSSGLNSVSLLPYQKNSARYLQNGIEIVSNGIAIINSYDGYYKIQVVSGNVSIFELCADRTIDQLDLGAYNTVNWNLFDVVVANNNTEGFIFPIIDYNGASVTQRQIDARRMLPAVWAKTILDKIFESIDYTYSGNFKTEEFANLIVPLATDSGVENFYIQIDCQLNHSPNTSSGNFVDIGALNIKSVDLNNNWVYGGLFSPFTSGGTSNGWQFIADTATSHEFIVFIPYESTGGGSDIIIQLCKIINVNGVYTNESIHDTVVVAGSTGTISYTENVFLNIGDRVAVVVKTTVSSDVIIFDVGCNLMINRSQVVDHAIFGQDLPVTINLPKIKQSDFIKLICQMYCISFQTDENSKNVTFNSFKQISDNIPNALDWSNKMDVNKPFSIEYTIGSYAQSNIFQYKEDESVNQGNLLFSGILTVNNESLPISQVVMQSPFAETEMTTKMNGLDVPYINQYDVIDDNFSLSVQPRLLYLDKQAVLSGGDMKYIDGVNSPQTSNTNIPLCYFVLAGKTSLGWNNNLLENNYYELQNCLTNVKRVTGMFKLTAIDISELDFSIPIFLNVQTPKIQINGNFYLNKINNFRNGELTQCELIRL